MGKDCRTSLKSSDVINNIWRCKWGRHGRMLVGRRIKMSTWWNNILKITYDGNRGWFEENLERTIVNGRHILLAEESD